LSLINLHLNNNQPKLLDMTKKINLLVVCILALVSCKKDKEPSYKYEGTIVGMSTCGYTTCILNVKNISGGPGIAGLVFATDYLYNFVGDNPFFSNGYEGKRILFNCSNLQVSAECSFMGQNLPFVKITSAIISENQDEDIDQRRINYSGKCLPFKKIFSEDKFDIDQDGNTDLKFYFMNMSDYSDLRIYPYDILIYSTDGKPVPSNIGDTIRSEGPYLEEWRRGISLLSYDHITGFWDDSYWRFGETGYLQVLKRKNNEFHSAWIQFKIELDSTCKCSVVMLDTYCNPIPRQNSLVGYKD
jgi:hypothetical protein